MYMAAFGNVPVTERFATLFRKDMLHAKNRRQE